VYDLLTKMGSLAISKTFEQEKQDQIRKDFIEQFDMECGNEVENPKHLEVGELIAYKP